MPNTTTRKEGDSSVGEKNEQKHNSVEQTLEAIAKAMDEISDIIGNIEQLEKEIAKDNRLVREVIETHKSRSKRDERHDRARYNTQRGTLRTSGKSTLPRKRKV